MPSNKPDASPLWVAVAIAVFFPYGLYLLWNHPTLGKKTVWWAGAIAYIGFGLLIPSPKDSGHRGSKLAALKAVTSHLDGFPGRFAPDSERTAFNDELQMLIDRFTGIAFDAKKNPSAAKAIVELFESRIEGSFNGHLYNILMEHIQGIYTESLDR
jgi:hypothetical protein